jgi:hypothetical protein
LSIPLGEQTWTSTENLSGALAGFKKLLHPLLRILFVALLNKISFCARLALADLIARSLFGVGGMRNFFKMYNWYDHCLVKKKILLHKRDENRELGMYIGNAP